MEMGNSHVMIRGFLKYGGHRQAASTPSDTDEACIFISWKLEVECAPSHSDTFTFAPSESLSSVRMRSSLLVCTNGQFNTAQGRSQRMSGKLEHSIHCRVSQWLIQFTMENIEFCFVVHKHKPSQHKRTVCRLWSHDQEHCPPLQDHPPISCVSAITWTQCQNYRSPRK